MKAFETKDYKARFTKTRGTLGSCYGWVLLDDFNRCVRLVWGEYG